MKSYNVYGIGNALVDAEFEVNDDFLQQSEQCRALLTEAGLVLKEKRQAEIVAHSTAGFQNTYNQIWVRPEVK